MKRWTPEHAKEVATRFIDKPLAAAWDLFGHDMRRAILDSCIMDEFRIADTVDSTITITAADIVVFRELVQMELAKGIKRRGVKVKLTIHEEP